MNEKFLTERSYSLQSALLAVNINPFSKANFFLKDGVSILGPAFSHYFLVFWMTNCIASEKEHTGKFLLPLFSSFCFIVCFFPYKRITFHFFRNALSVSYFLQLTFLKIQQESLYGVSDRHCVWLSIGPPFGPVLDMKNMVKKLKPEEIFLISGWMGTDFLENLFQFRTTGRIGRIFGRKDSIWAAWECLGIFSL